MRSAVNHRLFLVGHPHWQRVAVIILILLAVILAYLPGLHGPFILDDDENITLNPGVALKELDATDLHHALVSNDSGPLKRPIAALSFALNHYQAGGFENIFPFKLTNLLIHGINSLLVFLLALRLMRISVPGTTLTGTQRLQIAALAAGLWALHPIQLTNVLYVVQRMNSLSALFTFSGLLVFLHGREHLKARPRYGLWLMSAGVLGGTALGALAKENAMLLPLLALVLEYTLIQGLTQHSTPRRRTLWAFYVVTVAIPVLMALFFLLSHPDVLLGGYLARPFTLIERVLTEARVLWHYLGLLLLPDISRLGLFHDDIAVSTGLVSPLSTLAAVSGLCLVFAAAVAKARHYPVLSFGVLWYLAGHSLESGFLGLEIAFEHRNYVPSLGVFLCLSYGAVRYIARPDSRQKRYAPALIGIILLLVGTVTWIRAGTWSDIRTLSVTEARNHPRSARANDLAARVSLGRNDIPGAVRYTLQGLKAAPRETGFHIDLQILLAHLSFELNTLVEKQYLPQERRGAQLNVQGLPAGIEASTDADGLRLQYPGSTNAVIAQLLREQPVTVHAVVAFEHLTRCLTSGQPSCRPLQAPALNWLILATENPRTGKAYRGILAANAARLYALQNEFQNALKFMELAASLLPDHLPYRLARIDYMLRLGQPDQAAETMERVRLDWPRNDIQWSINKPLIDGIMDRLHARGQH
jgi:hypothetical protein